MIIQNTIVNGQELTLLEFGTGDIGVTFGEETDKERVFVAFANIKPREIGTFKNVKDELNGYQMECFMSFDNVASIDAVINNLMHAKSLLIK